MLIADDHAPMRAGVRLVLEGSGFEVVAECGDGLSAVLAAGELRPDVCILDVYMPGSGIEAAREIASLVPQTVILMLTVMDSDEPLFEALRAGANGYLLKDATAERLPDTIRAALRGEAAISRRLAARVLGEFSGNRSRRFRGKREGPRLTDREAEVLERLRDGQTTASVAQELGVSPVTVRRHISAAVLKLQAPDRAAAVEKFALL